MTAKKKKPKKTPRDVISDPGQNAPEAPAPDVDSGGTPGPPPGVDLNLYGDGERAREQALHHKVAPELGMVAQEPATEEHGTAQKLGTKKLVPSFSCDSVVPARLLNLEPAGQEQELWCWAATTQMMVGYLRSIDDEHACPTCARTGPADHDLPQGLQANRRLRPSDENCQVRRDDKAWYKACDQGGWPYLYEFEPLARNTILASWRHLLEEHGLDLIGGGPRMRLQYRLTDAQVYNLPNSNHRSLGQKLGNAEGAALSWEMLVGLIDEHRPVAFSYRYPKNRGGHLRLATGYCVTPDGQRWVVTCDPLPPDMGELYLIPYEFYVDGPFGGHWRDYWVAPAEKTADASLRKQSFELRVGRELVPSYMDDSEEPESDKTHSAEEPPGDGHRLPKRDIDEAREKATKGLEAVAAIAKNVPDLARMTGMGGFFLQPFGKLLKTTAAADKEIHPEDPKPTVDLDIGSDDLVLADKPIPVYELTSDKLKDWDPAKGYEALLGRPTETIWPITRKDLEPFSFFAAVTVRRHRGEWKLSSLGKTAVMAALAEHQTMAGLSTFMPIVKFLAQLGLLTPYLRSMPAKELRSWAQSFGYEEADIDMYLEKREGHERGVLDVEWLIQKAGEIDERDADDGNVGIDIEEPEFVLDIQDLYQLLIGYPDGKVEPVYPRNFHRPERRIKDGKLQDVLTELSRVAKEC